MSPTRSYFSAIMHPFPPKRTKDAETNQAFTKRYEAFAGAPIDDDLAVTVLIDLCVQENGSPRGSKQGH